MQNYQNFLNQTAPHQAQSIECYTVNETKVWLKKASQRHPWWIYAPFQWITKIFGLQLLTPVPNHGGKDAIRCEAERLLTLKTAGINVPEVLAQSEQGLLIQDIANPNSITIQLDHAFAQEPNFEQRAHLFLNAVEAIKKLHDKKQYLSEAFARNILVDEQHTFYFIDFETDPLNVLNLETCQARDWLCFLFSTAFRFNEEERPHIEKFFKEALHTNPHALFELGLIGKRFSWLNKIGVEKTGNDGKRLKVFLTFLKNI